jgi:hypothetical protein
MAEIIITIVILLICSIPLCILGITQYKSKEPVGFWSGKKPPQTEQVTDVKAYNQKHGMMWIIYGAGLPISFFLGMPFGGYIPPIAMGIECIGGIIVMVWYHSKLDHKYLIVK